MMIYLGLEAFYFMRILNSLDSELWSYISARKQKGLGGVWKRDILRDSTTLSTSLECNLFT